jgi:hydroxymethylpyrimidine/phosphomethylpyrimidine kinase
VAEVTRPQIPRLMTVAGSDSGGGAGIQADLKTFAALGAYGTSVITAITAQNTLGVTDVHEVPVATVAAQIDAVLEDIGADAVKTGMLASAEIIEAVAAGLKRHDVDVLVVDPVMVATTGARLLREDAHDALTGHLLPMATLVTPNVQEASALVGRPIETMEQIKDAARAIAEMGARAVVITGGLGSGPATDLLYADGEFKAYTNARIATTSTHGTGCTFASAAAVGLARGLDVRDAVASSKRYVHAAIRGAYPVGSGNGPVDHFHGLIGDDPRPD